jgi:hypothetical protein
LDLRSIDQWLSQARHRIAENDAGNLRPLILESEILMAAGMQLVIRDLALHPHSAEPGFQGAANGAGQFRDGKNLGRFLEEIPS